MYYPYAPGMYPEPVCETKKGLKQLIKSMYLSLVLTVVATILVSFVLSGMPDLLEEPESFDLIMESVIALIVLAIILLVVGLAAFILFITGLVGINKGKREFGPEHEKRVRLAIIFLVLSIVIAVVGSILSTALDPAFYGSGSSELSMLTMIAASMLAAALQFLFFAYLVMEISDEQRKKLLWIGFGMGMAGAALSAVIDFYFIPDIATASMSELTDYAYMSLVPMAIQLVATIIFIICYRHALTRIETGAIMPLAPPAPYYPPPPYSGYQ